MVMNQLARSPGCWFPACGGHVEYPIRHTGQRAIQLPMGAICPSALRGGGSRKSGVYQIFPAEGAENQETPGEPVEARHLHTTTPATEESRSPGHTT